MAYEDLTGKQRLFVDAYIGECNCNATESAIKAGYPARAAYAMGAENLRKPQIRAVIDERMRELTMPPEEILSRLTDHARGNLIDIVDKETGRLPSTLKGLTRQQAALIKKHSVKETKFGENVSVEIHDPQAALLALAKRYELFPDRLDVTSGGEKLGIAYVNDWRGASDPAALPASGAADGEEAGEAL